MSNKEITFDDLRLGIELEGAFSMELIDIILRNDWGSFCYDGSVDWHKLAKKIELAGGEISGDDYREFKSRVIGYNKLVNLLAGFSFPNYSTDSSCGLHLHISCPKIDPKVLNFIVADLDFLAGIKKMALLKFGDPQRRRLRNKLKMHYYQDYKTGEDLYYGIVDSSKYRFVRFHDQYKTLEFRFLYPYCDDPQKNINNINLLLSSLVNRINNHITIHKEIMVPVPSLRLKKLPDLELSIGI